MPRYLPFDASISRNVRIVEAVQRRIGLTFILDRFSAAYSDDDSVYEELEDRSSLLAASAAIS